MKVDSSISTERTVYLASLCSLCLSGAIVLVIGFYTTSSSNGKFDENLASKLWKHDFTDWNVYRRSKKWAWRKLAVTGAMTCSLLVSLIIKMIDVQLVILIGFGVFILWMSFLVYYWYFVVMKQAGMDSHNTLGVETSPNATNSNGNDIGWKSKYRDSKGTHDFRLPVTVITGFLG
jgi:hypothetical protein